jgi:hypothetical protein
MSSRVARFLTLLLVLGLLGHTSLTAAQSSHKKHHKATPAAAPTTTAAESSSDALNDLDSEAKPAPEPTPAPPPEDKTPPSDQADEQAVAAETPPETEADGNTAPAPAPSGPDVSADPFVGMGMGTRSFRRPTMMGSQTMNEQPFVAADVGIVFRAWPERAFSWAFLLRYRTSIGLQVKETPPFALPNYVSVRADELELSAAPTFRFGATTTAPRLAIPVGGQLRGFVPDVHNLQTPRYIIVGPYARAELEFHLTDGLSLRVGPELQWIVHFSKQLTNNGVKMMGIAVGGEASLHLALGTVFGLDLSFRQSTAMANVNYGSTFRDVERFLTLRLFGTL